MAADLLLDPELRTGPQLKKQLGVIRRQAGRMNRLIGDLLDVTRIEAGRLAVNAEMLPIRVLLADVSEALGPLVRQAGLDLVLQAYEDHVQVAADRERIAQVFSNLVGNAIKFTPPGGRITVRAEPSSDAVRFAVSDTGPGIPPDHLEHLFDRFWQARPSDRRGAGLGLAIARGILEAHEGEIGVESEFGRGTTFWFVLPRIAGSGSRA
jgi:signal transduction histidine kinase